MVHNPEDSAEPSSSDISATGSAGDGDPIWYLLRYIVRTYPVHKIEDIGEIVVWVDNKVNPGHYPVIGPGERMEGRHTSNLAPDIFLEPSAFKEFVPALRFENVLNKLLHKRSQARHEEEKYLRLDRLLLEKEEEKKHHHSIDITDAVKICKTRDLNCIKELRNTVNVMRIARDYFVSGPNSYEMTLQECHKIADERSPDDEGDLWTEILETLQQDLRSWFRQSTKYQALSESKQKTVLGIVYDKVRMKINLYISTR